MCSPLKHTFSLLLFCVIYCIIAIKIHKAIKWLMLNGIERRILFFSCFIGLQSLLPFPLSSQPIMTCEIFTMSDTKKPANLRCSVALLLLQSGKKCIKIIVFFFVSEPRLKSQARFATDERVAKQRIHFQK